MRAWGTSLYTTSSSTLLACGAWFVAKPPLMFACAFAGGTGNLNLNPVGQVVGPGLARVKAIEPISRFLGSDQRGCEVGIASRLDERGPETMAHILRS